METHGLTEEWQKGRYESEFSYVGSFRLEKRDDVDMVRHGEDVKGSEGSFNPLRDVVSFTPDVAIKQKVYVLWSFIVYSGQDTYSAHSTFGLAEQAAYDHCGWEWKAKPVFSPYNRQVGVNIWRAEYYKNDDQGFEIIELEVDA
jgi:hypothetical protein